MAALAVGLAVFRDWPQALLRLSTSPALRALMERFLAEHPAAQAARADLERAEAEARALGQALYNPELEFEYEDATDTTKSVGVSQTFDWNGKRRARDRASGESMRAASATLAAARQELLAELLEKLISVKVTVEAVGLSKQRVVFAERVRDLGAAPLRGGRCRAK